MSNIKFPDTFVNVRARESEESSVLSTSFLPSYVISGFCHDINKIGAMPKERRIITNKNDTDNLQKDLDTLGEWALENGMKINPGKSKEIRFTRARVKNPLAYSLGNQKNSGSEQL